MTISHSYIDPFPAVQMLPMLGYMQPNFLLSRPSTLPPRVNSLHDLSGLGTVNMTEYYCDLRSIAAFPPSPGFRKPSRSYERGVTWGDIAARQTNQPPCVFISRRRWQHLRIEIGCLDARVSCMTVLGESTSKGDYADKPGRRSGLKEKADLWENPWSCLVF